MIIKRITKNPFSRSNYFCMLLVLFAISVSATAEDELRIEELLSGNEFYDKAVTNWFNDTGRKIVGGKEAAVNQFPWQVSIGVSYISDPFRAQYCAGSIYKLDWIITAAHCVNRLRPYRIDITAGSNDLREADIRLNAKRIIVYPGYVHPEKGRDIALIQLNGELPLSAAIQKIPLVRNDSEIKVSSVFTIVGWGQTRADEASKSATLRFIENVPLVGRDTCNLPLSYDGRITEDMICSGFSSADRERDSCKGDSGGPLIMYTSDLAKQAGIVSWGEGCAVPLKYGVYTRVSKYFDWIEQCTSSPDTCS
jgi:trypsin